MNGFLFVNFKTYEQATGGKALALAKTLSGIKRGGVEIIPVAQALDIRAVASSVPLAVFAQHCDPVSYGSNTGKILPEALRAAGAAGSVINHAENKVGDEFAEAAVKRCREAGLKAMLCAEDIERAKKLAEFSPDFIAIEPPELIGGNVSVSTANPGLISGSVLEIRKINPSIKVITGAGVKTPEDVSKAIELGTSGVFVASGIVCAENPRKAVESLLKGFKN